MESLPKRYHWTLSVKSLITWTIITGMFFPTFQQPIIRHFNVSQWNTKNIETVVQFIEDLTQSLKWNEFFLFTDAMQETKSRAWLLKRFATTRVHLVNLPVENIGEVLHTDITSYYHKAIVWSDNDSMQMFVTQALTMSLFKSTITLLFIGSDLESIFDPVRHDYGEETYVATINWYSSDKINWKIMQPVDIQLLNGNIHTDSEIIHIGQWTSSDGLQWDHTTKDGSTPIVSTLHGTILQIAVREERPFYYYVRDKSGAIIRSRGMVSDLLNVLQDYLQLRLNITIPSETNSGTVDDTGQWNGLIGLLQKRRVDMVAADISLTEDRLKVADFSPPFLMASIGIAVRKMQHSHTDYHFHPFACSVWLLTITSIFLSTILLTASCCWSPLRHTSQKLTKLTKCPQITSDSDTDRDLNLGNFLFVMISLMAHQGFDNLPRPTSAKVIFVVHCFFAFLILESYSSVLTASLSTNYGKPPFTRMDELVDNPEYHFGIREGSSNVEYLKTSRSAVLQKAWARISSSPDHFCNSTETGLLKAATETYAYIDNYALLKYHLSSKCDFNVHKQGQDIRGYHFAFPKNSPFLKRISTVFRRLANAGILQRLRNRHFKTESNCNDDTAADENRVHLEHILGLLQFLAISYATAFLILTVEQTLKRNVNHKYVQFLFRLFASYVAKDHLKVVTVRKCEGT